MRARELGMPRVWLPDIEPEASNTIMASSVQGEGFFSSALLAERPKVSAAQAKPMIPSRKRRFLACGLPTIPATLAHSLEAIADFSVRNGPAKRFHAAS
jgi:hypothetical protein